MIKEANEFVIQNLHKVNPEFRHTYHMMPPFGWSNDPNGFSYFRGEYHLFYQYYPYEASVGGMQMCWGHAKSRDLLHWETLPIAIAPDQVYDKYGCWSGGAIEKDDILYLMYTGKAVKGDEGMQTQNIAFSKDGILFEKYCMNPVIGNKELPLTASRRDFRDPFVFEKGGIYYAIIGSKTNTESQILLYRSDDLLHWNYVGVVIKGIEYGKMCECPNYVHLNERDLLFFSPQEKPAEAHRYWNTSSTVYILGKLDLETGHFQIEQPMEEVDHGLDFYATHALTNSPQGPVMIAWMNMWGRRFWTANRDHNWCGSMTLPRQLAIQDDCLVQRPTASIKNAYDHEVRIERKIDRLTVFPEVQGRVMHLKVSADLSKANKLTLRLFQNGNAHTDLILDKSEKQIRIDRQEAGIDLGGLDFEKSKDGVRFIPYFHTTDRIELDLYLDNISIEAFIGNGTITMTVLSYNKPECDRIQFVPEGEVSLIVIKHDIKL